MSSFILVLIFCTEIFNTHSHANFQILYSNVQKLFLDVELYKKYIQDLSHQLLIEVGGKTRRLFKF